MRKRFEGKKAVVTGAAGDIGRLIVSQLLEEGADVLALDCDAERGELLSKQYSTKTFDFVEVDLTDPKAIKRALSSVIAVDILINAVGAILMRPATETTAEVWDHQFRVNATSPFLVITELADRLTKGSSIVSISSLGGIKAESGFAAYSASKAALIQLTKVLARELAPKTRVNVVSPGALDTQMPRKMLEGHPQADQILAGVASSNPLERAGTAEEVVPTVLFLVSDESSFANGANFVLDGGMSS